MENFKTVVVTGASRGIGKAVALRFAKEKCHIVIACRHNSDMLQDVQKMVLAAGSDCITYTGDLSIRANADALFDLTRSSFGSPDILINNAGVSHIGLLSDMTDNEWQNVIESNLYSVFYCCRNVIPDMVSNHSGRIVNISSVWGSIGASCEVAYSASKGALNAFTQALAKELAPSNIQVNALACGLIDTEMNSHLSSEELSELYEEIPMGRAGTACEAAEAVYSICCQSRYLTGQIITLDGGWI